MGEASWLMRDVCRTDLLGADLIVPVATPLQAEIFALRNKLNVLPT